MAHRFLRVGLAFSLGLPLASACGSDGGSAGGGSGGFAASSGSAGTAAAGGSIATGGVGGSGATGSGGTLAIDAGDGSSGSGGLQDGGACQATHNEGKLIPLDMYIMFDRSGSMLAATQAGATKWDAAKQALTTFVNDPAAASLGIGLQYFPLRPGVPDVCTSDAECGPGAPCYNRSCTNDATFAPCVSKANCPGALNQCEAFGECANDHNYVCRPIGGACSGGLGACQPYSSASCLGGTSCLVGDYSTPAVPIAVGSAAAVVASLNTTKPVGNTPTGPALQGAIDQARSYANANPGHTVIVVLATDGVPTECNPLTDAGLAGLAAAAAGATPAIKTFVIGVFAPTDVATAKPTLDGIANSGGTTQAFIIDTTTDVNTQFLNALKAIQGQSLACDFSIPLPPTGESLDFGKVNVDFSAAGSSTGLLYVADASQCDAQNGGWYYDQDPAKGGTPTKIIVCSSTCNVFKQTSTGQVDIKLGCKRNDQPPH